MEDKKQSDQRWSSRQSVSLPVKLYSGNEPTLQGHTQNLGIGGMFVETESKHLPLNSQLSVSFSVATHDGTSHHRLPATVVWADEHGAGLMFTDFNIETVHTLREVLYSP